MDGLRDAAAGINIEGWFSFRLRPTRRKDCKGRSMKENGPTK